MPVPDSHVPDEEETKKAKSRVVSASKAKAVILGVIKSAVENLREACGARLSDGGAIRSVPLTSSGKLDSSGDVLNKFRALGNDIAKNADKFEEFVLDWEEVESLKDIR